MIKRLSLHKNRITSHMLRINLNVKKNKIKQNKIQNLN